MICIKGLSATVQNNTDTMMDRTDFRLGVVMLATGFPRLTGDIGNPDSFPFPVLYRTVASARVGAVVRSDGPARPVADEIVAAAEALEADGANMIATSCGFLGGLQTRLQGACTVPVLASALVLLPWLRALYGPTAPIGILTFDSRVLAPSHFGAAADGPVVIEGIETGGELYRVISEDRPELDRRRAEDDAVAAARRLVTRQPDLAAIVLECTNLSPHRAAISAAVRRPVHDLITAIRMVGMAHGASGPDF